MLSRQPGFPSAFTTPLQLSNVRRIGSRPSPLTCPSLCNGYRTPSRPKIVCSLNDPQESPEDAMNSFNMELLRRRMTRLDELEKTGHKPTDHIINLDSSDDDDDDDPFETDKLVEEFERMGAVWVIVFTSTTDGSEGVYSLSIADENIVLAFQDKEEAQRYSFCLEAQKFPVPQVCELETSELREFCSESGFRLGFVPKGSLITPPDESAIEDIDKWQGTNNDSTIGMSPEDIETMKKRLDSLFGQ